ncbi:glycosyltransferase family 4 protein [Sulfurimonas sp. MAG313]|nr:glycosyltransferase family 4 protein [Sulfurimonas sp. MAG313]MDF1881091.1 glycosyltransferase family 4 protein [Sulfurimonas sp. MAG313]
MKNKNVMELCLSPDLGGLELYMMRAAKSLKGRFNVISIINTKGKLESYYKDTEHRYELLSKNSNLLMISSARKLAKIMDANKIDIVHLHWTKDIPICVLAKKLSKIKPKLVQTRNMNMTRFKDSLYHRFLYTNIDMMLPVTKKVEEQINKFIPEDIRPCIEVLYMGTDKLKLLSEEKILIFKKEHGMNVPFSVAMVGRIEEDKGQYLLIEALSKLDRVEAFFVGREMKEGYIQSLKEQAKKLGIENRVHFLGFLKEPASFMQACDAMVLATPCETFGLVVIEAMAAKTAMIATKACGPLEIIEDGISGMLFENNNIDELSNKIQLLAQDDSLINKITLKALKVTEDKFETVKQFDKLGNLFTGL